MDEHRVVDLTAVPCPEPRAAADARPELAQEVRAALNGYLAARLALRRAHASLESAEAVLAARIRLVHVLTESGWEPPPAVTAQLALDEALMHEPSREDPVRV